MLSKSSLKHVNVNIIEKNQTKYAPFSHSKNNLKKSYQISFENIHLGNIILDIVASKIITINMELILNCFLFCNFVLGIFFLIILAKQKQNSNNIELVVNLMKN